MHVGSTVTGCTIIICILWTTLESVNFHKHIQHSTFSSIQMYFLTKNKKMEICDYVELKLILHQDYIVWTLWNFRRQVDRNYLLNITGLITFYTVHFTSYVVHCYYYQGSNWNLKPTQHTQHLNKPLFSCKSSESLVRFLYRFLLAPR